MLSDLLKNLDTTKDYVVNEIGSSIEAKIIQDLQHKVYNKYQVEELPTHTFSLVYDNNEWHVFENHLKWGGTKLYPASEYSSDAKKFYINEYKLNTDVIDYLLYKNPGYSILNLAEIVEKRLLHLPLPNTKGYVCSQTIAACNYNICLDLKLEFEVITPADFYHYFTM